ADVSDGDVIDAGDGRNLVLGDSGQISAHAAAGPRFGDQRITLGLVTTIAPETGGADHITTGSGADLILGGAAGDTIMSGAGRDVILGDHAQLTFGAGTGDWGNIDTIRSIDLNFGGADVIWANAGEDLVVGGHGPDVIDGNEDDDLILGDAAILVRRAGDSSSLRFQALGGTLLYSRSDLTGEAGEESGELLVDGDPRAYRDPDGAPDWAAYAITELWHTATIEAGLDPVAGPASFGDDYLAGGPGHDLILGQLGDDVIQGDGSIESYWTAPVGAWRTPGGTSDPVGPLTVHPSFEAGSDGDDYVEGGGGSDVVFGGLGQDDLVGGSSSLFSL
ncbi:MAG: hypothetical protein WD067_02875, partial [Gaiellaceae bacterium]